MKLTAIVVHNAAEILRQNQVIVSMKRHRAYRMGNNEMRCVIVACSLMLSEMTEIIGEVFSPVISSSRNIHCSGQAASKAFVDNEIESRYQNIFDDMKSWPRYFASKCAKSIQRISESIRRWRNSGGLIGKPV